MTRIRDRDEALHLHKVERKVILDDQLYRHLVSVVLEVVEENQKKLFICHQEGKVIDLQSRKWMQ